VSGVPGVRRVVSPAPRAEWSALVAADRGATTFQTPAWLDCVTSVTGGTDASRLYELDDGRQAVLPLVRAPRLPGALRVEAALPHGWGAGCLLASGGVTSGDVVAVLADLARRPALRTTLRPPSRDAAAWAAAVDPALPRTAHCEQVLDLSGGWDEVWQHRFTGKVRRAVRKAEASSLEVEHDTTGRLVPAFYDLYLQSVDRWAAAQHEPLALARLRARRRDPLQKFSRVGAQLGPALHVWLARLDGRPAAAVLVLVQGGTATYWRGAMDVELAGPHRANDLLHRLAVEDACSAGCDTYAMGDSGTSANLTRFKESFGAVSRHYESYRLERLPLTRWDAAGRGAVKRLIGFRDA
jgi:hypothetical protein